VEANGLSLCALHHKLFDLGAFTLEPDGLRIAFSRHAIAGSRGLSSLRGTSTTCSRLWRGFEGKITSKIGIWRIIGVNVCYFFHPVHICVVSVTGAVVCPMVRPGASCDHVRWLSRSTHSIRHT
jgi:hypothetical protein